MTTFPRFQAVILAGGLGTRLRSVVSTLPKVMAPVAGQPFLHHILRSLSQQGFARVVLAVGYMREAIMDSVGSEFLGMQIQYSVEDELLGTGGAVRQALSLVEPGLCFVLNGDTWVDLDYAAMYREHLAANVRLSIAVKEIDDVSRFGTLQISNRHITGFLEKGSCGRGSINAGAYLMPTDLLAEQTLPKVFSLEQDFFMPQLSSLHPLAHHTAGTFIDIGIPIDYDRAQMLLGTQSNRADASPQDQTRGASE